MQIREYIYQLQQRWQVGMAEAGKSEVISSVRFHSLI